MRKRSIYIMYIMFSVLVVGALVLTSCGGGAKTTVPATTTAKPAATTAAPPTSAQATTAKPSTSPSPAEETPQYGGTLNLISYVPSLGTDEGTGTLPWFALELHYTNEDLIGGDYAKGLGGAKTTSFIGSGMQFNEGAMGNLLCEKWEIKDAKTLFFYIRKGVKWQNKAPVNGRDFTASDVVFNFQRAMVKPSYIASSSPAGREPTSFTAVDNYTVKVECKTPADAAYWVSRLGELIKMVPPEVINQYKDMKDWKNVVGTGPFTLTDMVPNSVSTFQKNPNYWGYDPLHPKYKLPYVDTVKLLIIEDQATREAAIRSARVDIFANDQIEYESYQSLKKSSPDIQWARQLQLSPYVIFMRLDKPDLPFKDIRVRQALSMAIDRKTIVDKFYSGDADILCFPLCNITDLADLYTPLDKMPQAAQDLYKFDQAKAKKLLADAGYPSGFKTSIVCWNINVDMLSLIKAYWAQIGVDLTLDVKEYTVYSSIARGRTHEQMVYNYLGTTPNTWDLKWGIPGLQQNMSYIDDKRVNDTYNTIWNNYFDVAKRKAAVRDLFPYTIEQAWFIQPPNPYVYEAWWPWVKNYHGEVNVGYMDNYNAGIWVWLDQALKKKITGQ